MKIEHIEVTIRTAEGVLVQASWNPHSSRGKMKYCDEDYAMRKEAKRPRLKPSPADPKDWFKKLLRRFS